MVVAAAAAAAVAAAAVAVAAVRFIKIIEFMCIIRTVSTFVQNLIL